MITIIFIAVKQTNNCEHVYYTKNNCISVTKSNIAQTKYVNRIILISERKGIGVLTQCHFQLFSKLNNTCYVPSQCELQMKE